MTGWIALPREIFASDLAARPFCRGFAFAWLVAHAAWRPVSHDFAGVAGTVERGQLAVTVRQLAEAWGWTKSSVDRFLARLVREGRIMKAPFKNRSEGGTNDGTRRGSGKLIVTICNFDLFQGRDTGAGTRSGTGTGTISGQNRDTKEELTIKKKIEEEEEGTREDFRFARAGEELHGKPVEKPRPPPEELPPVSPFMRRILQAAGHDPDGAIPARWSLPASETYIRKSFVEGLGLSEDECVEVTAGARRMFQAAVQSPKGLLMPMTNQAQAKQAIPPALPSAIDGTVLPPAPARSTRRSRADERDAAFNALFLAAGRRPQADG